MRGKRRTIPLLMAVAVLGSGCGSRSVDYNIEDTQQTGETAGQENTGLSQFAEEKRWTENLEITGGENGDVSVNIRATVVLPEDEEMSVVEVSKPQVDEAYRETILGNIFGETQLYYYTDEKELKELARCEEKPSEEVDYDTYDMTRAQLEDLLKEWETILEEWQNGERDSTEPGEKEQSVQNCELQIRKLKQAMQTAPEEYVPAAGYDRDSYLGYVEGVPYQVSMEQDQFLEIEFQPVEYGLVCPDELQNAAWIQAIDGKMQTVTGTNQCQKQQEDAQREAEAFLQKVGVLGQCHLMETYPVIWEAYMEQVGHNTWKDDKTILDGYAFYFGQGESSATEFPDSSIAVYVNDGGVFYADIVSPFDVISVTEQVPLLPMDSIQQIIRNELQENPDDYFWSTGNSEYSYHTLELLYKQVADQEQEGYYSYVPVWRLYGYGNSGNSVTVNAIDGGIVNEGE